MESAGEPVSQPHIQDYQWHFLETYGEGAEVPLLDLLSPENGLDAPVDTSRRKQRLQRIVAQAVNQGTHEVELTESLLTQLEREPSRAEQAPRSLEIYLHVQASSREALDRGEWTAVIGPNGGSPMAGRTFGRFFDLLGEPGYVRLQRLVEQEEALQPNAIFAELSYQPLLARVANLTLHPPCVRMKSPWAQHLPFPLNESFP